MITNEQSSSTQYPSSFSQHQASISSYHQSSNASGVGVKPKQARTIWAKLGSADGARAWNATAVSESTAAATVGHADVDASYAGETHGADDAQPRLEVKNLVHHKPWRGCERVLRRAVRRGGTASAPVVKQGCGLASYLYKPHITCTRKAWLSPRW